ncbi:MAG TPA: ABC transporter substrate-binding protein [Nevskiaceae bacterium]
MRHVYGSLLGAALLLVGATAGARAAAPVEVGYMPIIPDAQAFVVLGGETAANPLAKTHLVEFQDGPAIVQALLAGQLDVAYVGIGPAMVARTKGADIRIVASNIVDQINLLALGDLAPYFADGEPATAFARFAAAKGRKPVITTFARGSTPAAVLEHWLKDVAHVDPASYRIVYQGAAQAQQALLVGAVDAATVPEPAASIVMARRPGAKIVVPGSRMFPDQPGAVLVVRQRLIDRDPTYVQELVDAQVAATRLLNEQPQKVLPAVQKYVGGGRLPANVVLAALRRSHFEANPHRILASTQRMRDFQVQTGVLKGKLDVTRLFDTRFYDHVGE